MLGIFGLSEPHGLDVSFELLIYTGLVFCFSLFKNLDPYNNLAQQLANLSKMLLNNSEVPVTCFIMLADYLVD
jgi:hypothetical protein